MIFNSKSDTLHNLYFRVGHVVNILIQKLTRCSRVRPKTDMLCIFQFHIWDIVSFYNSIWLKKFINSKTSFLKNTKSGNSAIFLSRTKKDVIPWMQSFLQNLKQCKNCTSKTDALQIISFEVCHLVKTLFWNLARFKNFISESDTL